MYRDLFSFAQASFAQASILLMSQVRKGVRRMEMPRGSWGKRGGRALRPAAQRIWWRSAP
ncbi:hypothetical protein C3488_31455 [Streptomyces sp. Ru72]|nr:hypothetical protein C3488_31455 [Streptomyces sp. Ru72]